MDARTEERDNCVTQLLTDFDFTNAGPDPYRDLLVEAWNAGAHWASTNEWDVEDEDSTQHDAQCNAEYVTGPVHDPYATSCDLPNGHYPKTPHEAPDPFGGNQRVSWTGGGSIQGDRVPQRNVKWIDPPSIADVQFHDNVHD
jgi:hypothetical protein